MLAMLVAWTAAPALAPSAHGGDAREAGAAHAARRPSKNDGASVRGLRAIEGRATIVDGDGVEIDGVKVRLFGVDAPEIEQYCWRGDGSRWRCGQYATVALDRLAGGRDVSCAVRDQDRYGRPVAVCTIEGRDLAAEQASAGWALAYRQFSQDYVDEERAAQGAKLGVWAGRFEAPWVWRQKGRTPGR
jgi:endonuclease YncB( thermonuclease family)